MTAEMWVAMAALKQARDLLSRAMADWPSACAILTGIFWPWER